MKYYIYAEKITSPYISDAVRILTGFFDENEFLGFAACNELADILKADGLPVITESELIMNEFDYVILMGCNDKEYSVRRRMIASLGINKEKILSEKIIITDGFSPEKYAELENAKLTIISRNCFAGLLYNHFCLPFLSPTINMYFEENAFVRFLSEFDRYINSPLVLDHMEKLPDEDRFFPVFSLDGDVLIYMNHYSDDQSAGEKWNERLKRMNPENMMYVMDTETLSVLERFNDLPYKNKVCFVPFETDVPCAYTVPMNIPGEKDFFKYVNSIATGSLRIFDLWDMLCKNQKKCL